MDSSSRIIIHRHYHHSARRDAAKTYKIMLDGRVVAEIGERGDVEVPTAPGLHRVRIRLNWSGSPVVKCQTEPGADVHLEVRPAGTYPFPRTYWRMITRTRWLELGVLPWRGYINGVLYAVQFDRELSDPVVERIARLVEEDRGLPGGAPAHIHAIHQALSQSDPLDVLVGTRFGEDEIRSFLTRLAVQLERGST